MVLTPFISYFYPEDGRTTRRQKHSQQQKQKFESHRNSRDKQKTSRKLDSELRLFNDAWKQTAGRHNGPRGTVMRQQATPSNTIQRKILSCVAFKHRHVPGSLYPSQRSIPRAHAFISTFTVRWLLYVPHSTVYPHGLIMPVLYGCQNKPPLLPYTPLTDVVFTNQCSLCGTK